MTFRRSVEQAQRLRTFRIRLCERCGGRPASGFLLCWPCMEYDTRPIAQMFVRVRGVEFSATPERSG